MPPIPIYSKSPINASKASGVTPQTDGGDLDAKASGTASQPTTTQQAAVAPQHHYPAAQPGAGPSLPAPTGSVQAQKYAPVQPTPTRSLDSDDGPAAPQPGAVPVPPGARSTLPPPPKAGEAFHPPVQTSAPQPASIPYPAQMGIPAPTVPGAQRGTSTAFTPGAPMPIGLGSGAADSVAHPPGYQQDIHASDFNSDQRAAAAAAATAAETQAHQPRTSSREVSYDGLGTDGREEGVWDFIKKTAQATGGKLAEAESEVWKRINKQ